MQSIKKDSGEISNKFDDILNLFFKMRMEIGTYLNIK
jgi:hypothetical protein